MLYKVVCIKEFSGIRSNGTVTNIRGPVLDAIYNVVDENIDGYGVHALIMAELPYKAGYNSEHFRPLEGCDLTYESEESVLEEVLSGSGM